MRIRRSVYWKFGEPITLAFIACVGDQHPEIPDDAPPPAPTAPPPRLKFKRDARWSDRNIRRALGKDPKQAARVHNQVGFERTLRRIIREGA